MKRLQKIAKTIVIAILLAIILICAKPASKFFSEETAKDLNQVEETDFDDDFVSFLPKWIK